MTCIFLFCLPDHFGKDVRHCKFYLAVLLDVFIVLKLFLSLVLGHCLKNWEQFDPLYLRCFLHGPRAGFSLSLIFPTFEESTFLL